MERSVVEFYNLVRRFLFATQKGVQRSTEQNSYKFPRVNPFLINWHLMSQ